MAHRRADLLVSHGRRLDTEKFSQARIAKGLTQKGLAEAAGVNLSTVESWEAGRRQALIPTLEAICAVLGVKVEDVTEAVE